MTKTPAAAIRLLGSNRSYADGAEEDVLSALEKVADHSDGSDELYSHAVDWPTTYHFSPRRSNIMRPFEIKKRHRVLEIGAGTGAITRYLGETGAEVTALEGEAIRAQAIATRCADLANVEVVSGSLFDFKDPSGFDLVVIIGVLEYAGPATSDHRPQLDFLRYATDLLRPGGTLVLAIENQIGLKYLLGYSEDHLNQPWAGVEGYPGSPSICTVPRTTLGSLLDDSGLTAQRWYYPYPDYKLPRAILSEEAFDLPASKEVVDQLVGRPIVDLANPPTRFCDDRACHRVFLDAHLGPDVANSFLVAAAHQDAALDDITDDSVIAWHFSSDRLKRWRRSQTVRRIGGDLRLTAGPTYPKASSSGTSWLGQDPNKDEAFVVGRTLEQQALESSRSLNTEGLTDVIRRWHAILAENETPPADKPDEDIPFAPRPGRAGLPPEYLDASLSNFVDSGDAVVFIDREWHLDSPVDAELTRIRALWYFALDLVVSGVAHPFGAQTSVDDLAITLAELVDLDLDRALIEEFIADEARVQEVVTGNTAERIEADLRDLGSTSRTEKEATSNLPIAQIRRDLVQLGGFLHGMESQAEESRRYQVRLEEEISASSARMLELQGEYRRLEEQFRHIETHNQELTAWAKSLKAQTLEQASWAKDLETQNKKAANWAKNVETQNDEIAAWAKNLEPQSQEAVAWAKNLEIQNKEATNWARTLEAQIKEVTSWAKSLEIKNQEATTWAKDVETQNQKLATWAKDLETQIQQAQTREHDLIRAAAEAEKEIARINTDRTALELRVLGLAREVEDLRTWKQRASSRPLVKFALALHQFISPVDTDD